MGPYWGTSGGLGGGPGGQVDRLTVSLTRLTSRQTGRADHYCRERGRLRRSGPEDSHVQHKHRHGQWRTATVRARTMTSTLYQLGRDTRNQPAWTMDSHGTTWLHANNCPGRLICEAQCPPPPRDLPPPTYTREGWAAIPHHTCAVVAAAARKSCGAGWGPVADTNPHGGPAVTGVHHQQHSVMPHGEPHQRVCVFLLQVRAQCTNEQPRRRAWAAVAVRKMS